MKKIFITLLLVLLIITVSYATSIIETKSVLGEIVVVKKMLHGNDASSRMILTGTIRNISNRSYRWVDVGWDILDDNNKIYKVVYDNKEEWTAYYAYIKNLNSKAEADFEIIIDLSNKHISQADADLIKKRVFKNQYKIDILAPKY